jgi:hypothetical protein
MRGLRFFLPLAAIVAYVAGAQGESDAPGFSERKKTMAEQIWVKQASGGVMEAGGGYSFSGFRIDAGVWPVAPGHRVGIVYTSDGWRTATWGTFSWQSNNDNDYGSQDELWSFKWVSGNPYVFPSSVQYAIYVDDAYGNRSWNNNGGWNYEVHLRAGGDPSGGGY